jgi:hypothetical protein
MVRVTVEATDSDPPALDFGAEEVLFDWRYQPRLEERGRSMSTGSSWYRYVRTGLEAAGWG